MLQAITDESRHILVYVDGVLADVSQSYRGAILDRSISGDRVFAKMLWKEGHMSEECWHVYESSYDGACRTLLPPTKLLFLDVQPRQPSSA